MLFSKGGNVYSKNFVRDTRVVQILDEPNNIVAMAVDANLGHLFAATWDKDEEVSEVFRWDLKVNVTNRTHPYLYVNETSKLKVMKGEHITDLSIDDDQSILYIADEGEKKLS